jgi:lysozyme family protein
MMPVATAREIYSKWYITDPGFDKVKSDPLRLVLVDSGVLFGVGRATIWLQQELNLHPDGKIGDSMLAALQNYQPAEKLPRRVLGRRFGAIADIVKSKPTQVVFLGGWINRAVSLLDYV